MQVIMVDIYRNALDSRFQSIVEVISSELGHGTDLTGLTAETRNNILFLAEQAIIDWSIVRKDQIPHRQPLTNLQHLLDDYCALADYL